MYDKELTKYHILIFKELT